MASPRLQLRMPKDLRLLAALPSLLGRQRSRYAYRSFGDRATIDTNAPTCTEVAATPYTLVRMPAAHTSMNYALVSYYRPDPICPVRREPKYNDCAHVFLERCFTLLASSNSRPKSTHNLQFRSIPLSPKVVVQLHAGTFDNYARNMVSGDSSPAIGLKSV